MRPTAIKADQSSASFKQEFMVFGTKHLAAERLKDDPALGNRANGFVEGQIASL